MTLRKLLKQAGMMSRLLCNVGLFCNSDDGPYFCVTFEASYEGYGPCYNFYTSDGDDTEDVYYIPDNGSPWDVDLESEDWFIDADDIEEFKLQMKRYKDLEEELCAQSHTV